MIQETPPTVSRLQRSLAFIIAGLVILSLIMIAAILAGTALGTSAVQQTGTNLWAVVEVIPLIALPTAFVLMIVLFIVSGKNRSRRNRNPQR